MRFGRLTATTRYLAIGVLLLVHFGGRSSKPAALPPTAERRGTSISALLRELIEEHLRAQRTGAFGEDPLWEMVGIGHGGPGKASEEHDAHLAGARQERLAEREDRQG